MKKYVIELTEEDFVAAKRTLFRSGARLFGAANREADEVIAKEYREASKECTELWRMIRDAKPQNENNLV